ncbi:MAG: carbohydrate-binding protein [Dethiobacteria bacterium]|jgi:hypothetical protein|nr:carbohydrate-binding protein [Bacillota bacterium]
MHRDDRITVEPGRPRRGQDVKIDYQGLLVNSGADGIWMHYGYDSWKQVKTIPMTRQFDGSFTCSVRAEAMRQINFCFKDSAANWDNNNGMNWTIEVC